MAFMGDSNTNIWSYFHLWVISMKKKMRLHSYWQAFMLFPLLPLVIIERAFASKTYTQAHPRPPSWVASVTVSAAHQPVVLADLRFPPLNKAALHTVPAAMTAHLGDTHAANPPLASPAAGLGVLLVSHCGDNTLGRQKQKPSLIWAMHLSIFAWSLL